MLTCACVRCVSECVCRVPCPSVRLTQLEEPALAVRVEEGMSEVVAVVLRDGEGLTLDAVEEVLSPEKRGEDRAVMSSPVQSLGPAGPVWPGNSPCFPQAAGVPDPTTCQVSLLWGQSSVRGGRSSERLCPAASPMALATLSPLPCLFACRAGSPPLGGALPQGRPGVTTPRTPPGPGLKQVGNSLRTRRLMVTAPPSSASPAPVAGIPQERWLWRQAIWVKISA